MFKRAMEFLNSSKYILFYEDFINNGISKYDIHLLLERGIYVINILHGLSFKV